MRTTATLLLSAVLVTLGFGCSEATIDCQNICQAKKDCVDSEYDVDACRTDCEDRSEKEDDYRSEAHECEACLDGKACAEAIACFDNCPSLR